MFGDAVVLRAVFDAAKAEMFWTEREPIRDSSDCAPARMASERALLGSMVANRSTCRYIIARVEFDNFVSWRHRYLLAAIAGLAAELDAGGLEDVLGALKATETLGAAGGADYVALVAACASAPETIDEHLEVVLSHWSRGEVLH